MNSQMLKIDPYRQTITDIEFSDSLTQLCQVIHARHLTLCALNRFTSDSVLVDADAVDDELTPPAWILKETGETFFGTGVLVNVSDEGQYRPPLMNRYELLECIEFVGFIQPQVSINFADLDFLEDDVPDNTEDAE